MLLIIALIMTFLPLLGIAGIFAFGTPTTVDGLFMLLILAAIAVMFAGNAFFEYRKWRSGFYDLVRQAHATQAVAVPDGLIQKGRVESVEFFEAHVGQPNKSIVVISNAAARPQTLVIEGDMRNALPTGSRVAITLQKMAGYNVLIDVSYS